MTTINQRSIRTTLSLAVLMFIFAAFAASAQISDVIDLDARGGFYSGWVIVRAGLTTRLSVSVREFDVIEITIAPTQAPVEVVIRDPENKIIKTEVFPVKRSIRVNIELKGVWILEFRSGVDQHVSMEIKAISAPKAQISPPPAVFPAEYIVLIIGGSVAVVIAIVAILAIRKKPGPSTTPQPAPSKPPIPSTPAPESTSGETVLLERKVPASAKETEIMLATLELPDGRIIPITSPRQVFGRADFENYVSSNVLSYISRRHFMISLEPGGFFIEDLGSANGTTVNDIDIRGKGKVPLKSGDVIGVGGVIKLRFKAGG